LLTIVLNPASGASAKVNTRRLVDAFGAEGVEIKTIELAAGRVDAIVRDAVANAEDTVVAAGGDGTVSSVAAALAGTSRSLGVLPVGTLNHFAKDLHIPLDLELAVKTIVARRVVRVDVGSVNSRVFINNSSIGVYPGIVEMREELRRQGHPKWAAMAIATGRMVHHGSEVFVRVEVNGRAAVTRTPFLFVGNNEYTIEGVHLGERARLDSGRLYAYLAPRLHTRDLPKLLLWSLMGRARRSSAFASFSAAEMWIETPRSHSIRVATDGEITMLPTPLHYKIVPGALKVIVPAG
jgi:diacylglycerol kinase family enzyme